MNEEMTIAGIQYCLSGDRLRISQQDDLVLDVCLSPVLDGKKIKISRWENTGTNSYKASLGEYGEAFVCEKFERLAFWIETPVRQFENVTYLSDGDISGEEWRTFVSDEYERLWEKKIDVNIPISSAYQDINSPDGGSEGGMTDPDDLPTHWIWNIHVRAAALKGADRWLGISIPGPWGIGVTRLNMHRMRFNLQFEVLQAGCTSGKMPVIYFCPGLSDGFDVLDEHRRLSEKLGLMNLERKEFPCWWNNLWFCYWDEMERQRHNGLIDPHSSNLISLLTDWVKKVRESCEVKEINTDLEQGCFRLYGDYRPAKVLGTEQQVRDVIDSWREQGVRVGYYIHPFLVNTKVKFYQDHPEAFCKPKEPGFLMSYALELWDSDDPKFAPVDWTHPLGREFMLGWVDYILSPAPGCLNCDILRSNHWRTPDPRFYDFHDPSWGIGDMMTYKVQKLLYERAKKTKPDCLVTKVAALDCYMQPTYDKMQICEDFTSNMQFWYRRTHLVTRLARNSCSWIDTYFVTRTKWNEYFMSLLCLGTPETVAVEHAPHPYHPRWQPLKQKHFRRRKSGIHVYLNATPEPEDECHLRWNFAHLEVYRRKTAGPLAGWYGALALSPKCFVTYNESQALIGASENRTDSVPLPPRAELEQVTRVLHNGSEEEVDYLFGDERRSIQLHIEDCGGEVFYYKIKYRLG